MRMVPDFPCFVSAVATKAACSRTRSSARPVADRSIMQPWLHRPSGTSTKSRTGRVGFLPVLGSSGLAYVLADLPLQLVGRIRSDRVLRLPKPPRPPGTNGRPPKHGPEIARSPRVCVVHLLRNSFRYAGRQHWDAIAKALRPIYTAPTEAAAMERFLEFADA